jgi:glycosyltransferase involved in cell wall biosynthesis
MRNGLLQRAITSVLSQTLLPDQIEITIDHDKRGAAHTRQRGLDKIDTDLVAFLDSDDFWYAHHLATLTNLMKTNGADFGYSWFDGNNPFPMHRGRQMDSNDPHHTTMNVVVKTELAKSIGFVPHPDANEVWPGEDWNFIYNCAKSGAKFIGTAEVTWHYAVHQGNTSGLPTQGDAQ